nr:TatD family hydrolase [Candidatus Saccharibacteria bacterium]
MQLIDTHCHIHDLEFFDGESANSTYNQASEQLEALLLIGTSLVDSKRAVEFAHLHPEKCWACVGIHPHEASKLTEAEITEHLAGIAQLASDEKVRAIGECGFDFYYNERSEVLSKQKQLFAGQLEIAKQYNLPLSFHVREAFDDFWPVFDEFTGIRGVLHSFTDRPKHLEKALERGLYIGINGIATFTSHDWQRELFKTIPIESI